MLNTLRLFADGRTVRALLIFSGRVVIEFFSKIIIVTIIVKKHSAVERLRDRKRQGERRTLLTNRIKRDGIAAF